MISGRGSIGITTRASIGDRTATEGDHRLTKLFIPRTPPGSPPPASAMKKSQLSFGVVCSSNINRSMEAHLVLSNAGLTVESYGTGSTVRLPGRNAMEPRVK
jgi:hypothetical protein